MKNLQKKNLLRKKLLKRLFKRVLSLTQKAKLLETLLSLFQKILSTLWIWSNTLVTLMTMHLSILQLQENISLLLLKKQSHCSLLNKIGLEKRLFALLQMMAKAALLKAHCSKLLLLNKKLLLLWKKLLKK